MHVMQCTAGRAGRHQISVPKVRERDQTVHQVQEAEHSIYLPAVRFQGTIIMGNVAIILKMMPESPEVDLGVVRAAILDAVPGTKDIREEPIGFGLSAIRVLVVVPDEEGAPDRVEEAFRAIDGLSSVEIVELTLT